MWPWRPPRAWLGTSTASQTSLPSSFLPKHHHFHKRLRKSKQLQAGAHQGDKNQTEPNKLTAGCPAELLARPPRAGGADVLSFPNSVPWLRAVQGTLTLFKTGLAAWGAGSGKTGGLESQRLKAWPRNGVLTFPGPGGQLQVAGVTTGCS